MNAKYIITKTYTAGHRRGESVRVSDYTRGDSIAGASREGSSDEWVTREEAVRTLAYLIGEHFDDCGQSRTDLLTDDEWKAMKAEIANLDEQDEDYDDKLFEIKDRYTDVAIDREAKSGFFDAGDYTMSIEEVAE